MEKSQTNIILKNHIKDLSEKSQEKNKRNKQIYDYDNYKFKYDKNMDILIMEDMERNFISKFKNAKTDTKYYKYYGCIQKPKCKGRIKKTINSSKNENENTISNNIDYNKNEEDNICKYIYNNDNLYSDINNELSSEDNNENISITDNVMSLKEILYFRKEQLIQLFFSEKNLNKKENNKELIEDNNDDNIKNNDISNDNDNSLLSKIKRKNKEKNLIN